MSGTPVFVGTRVPFQTLLDYLEAGQPLSEFLADFPTVSRELAIAALEQAKDARNAVLPTLSSPWRPPLSSAVGSRGLKHETGRKAVLDDAEHG